jgi:hypothetical protein
MMITSKDKTHQIVESGNIVFNAIKDVGGTIFWPLHKEKS